jgi:hypothetical protein
VARLSSCVLAAALLSACRQAPAPSAQAAPAQTPARAALPADFVICIDNSRSITKPQQTLIRETTMLLADLADVGDQLSVITFGEGARIVATQRIRGNADRRSFKQLVKSQVDFHENRSDIRAGIRLLAEQQATLFRPGGQSIRAPVLLSDGRLEPVDGNARAAFNEMQADVSGRLAQTDIYAVALGDTTSTTAIFDLNGSPLNGLGLMRDYVARAPDRFFHARDLDELLQIAVLILNRTKGIASLGEAGATEFRIDGTVESMGLIVRKRSTRPAASAHQQAGEGRALFDSRDIRVSRRDPPGDPPATSGNPRNLYWSSDYTYFDFIVARHPAAGMWAVDLPGVQLPAGEKLEVLSRIVTPVSLRVGARDFYYLNENAALTAGLFDERVTEWRDRPYEIQAHLADDGNLAQSTVYAPLQREAGGRRLALRVPADLWRALGRPGAPGTVVTELIAKTEDPWFVRRSAPITLQVVAPFIDWTVPDALVRTIPFRDARVGVGGRIDPSRKFYPGFEVPPSLTVSVERLDGTDWVPFRRETVPAAAAGQALVYRFDVPLPTRTRYRFGYALRGNTRRGPFEMAGLSYETDVRLNWLIVLVAAAFVLTAGHLLSAGTARLQGQVTVEMVKPKKEYYVATVAPAASWDSASLDARARQALGDRRFVVRARRSPLPKRIWFTMQAGEGSLDSVPIRAGERRRLPRGEHRLTFQRPPNVQGEVKLTLV